MASNNKNRTNNQNRNTQVVRKQTNSPARREDQMETMQYKTNQANFNYNGITLNVDIPEFLGNIKKFKENQQRKKANKELQKLRGKTLEDVKCYEDVEYVEIDESYKEERRKKQNGKK